MQRIFGICIVAVFVLAAQPVAAERSVEQVPNPQRTGKWVTDLADMLYPAEEAELNAMIEAAEQEMSVEIAVVTVHDVDTPTPKDFATELFNYWEIGKRDVNNGLLVLMVKNERRLEMETGYGTEAALPDGWLKSMQEAEMVPRFKEGQFGDGIIEGVELSIDRMRDHRDGLVSSQSYSPSLASRAKSAPWWFWFFGGGLGLGGAGAAWKRRRDRMCTKCKKKMTILPEEEDDQHLDAGQITEEEIGSVDWDYWYCEDCGESKLLANNKWFSGFSKCKRCKNKTLSVTEETISAATYTSSGQAQVTSDCQHCSYHRTSYRVLPMLTRTESSSSSSYSGGSSGGSFGGGSSGGGGAGSSW